MHLTRLPLHVAKLRISLLQVRDKRAYKFGVQLSDLDKLLKESPVLLVPHSVGKPLFALLLEEIFWVFFCGAALLDYLDELR